VVNGSAANSAVTIGNGGTLAGSGSVGAVTVGAGGLIAPGCQCRRHSRSGLGFHHSRQR
jgi:hypothetical protein